MALLKVCSMCGRVALPGSSRCALHPKPPKRTGTYGRDAAKVRAAATICYLCGEPFTRDDPPVADHVQPRARGGSDHISNLAAAHRSCNGRKGATLPSWTS
jgi:5-methylcytosine-specific restriction endonuclease McrA